MDTLVLKVQENGNIGGGCSELTSFPLSSARFSLTSSEFPLEEIPVPFFTASAGFGIASFAADEPRVCSGE